MKIAIILRSVSGAGKSTFAECMQLLLDVDCEICTTDDFFIKDGEYKFNPKQLGIAHNICKNKFIDAMKNNVDVVICANTNTTQNEADTYISLAKDYGYMVFSLVVENVNKTIDTHGVPDLTKEKQAQNIRHSLRLM